MGSNDGNESRYAIRLICSLSLSLSIFFSSVSPRISFSSFFAGIDRFIKVVFNYLDRLDGLYQRRTSSTTRSSSPIEKRLSSTMMVIDETPSESSATLQSKKKKVRWADIEEDVLHQHKRAGTVRTSVPMIAHLRRLFFFFYSQWASSLVKLNKTGNEWVTTMIQLRNWIDTNIFDVSFRLSKCQCDFLL